MDVLGTLDGAGVFHFGGNAATVYYALIIRRTRGGIVSGGGTLTGKPAIMRRAADVRHGTLARLNGDRIELGVTHTTDGTAFVKTTGAIPGF